MPKSIVQRAARASGKRSLIAAFAAAALVATVSGSAGATTPAAAPARLSAAASSKPLVTADSSPWTTWEFNPWGSAFPGAASGYVVLPLAAQSWPHLTKYLPALATSWKVSGDTLTVQLRQHVNWQDGSAFTSTDLMDTLLLDGAAGNTIWNDITDLAAPNAHEVVLTMPSSVAPAVVENNLFSLVTPEPASVYGKYVIPNMKADDLAYAKIAATNPAKAETTAAGKALSAAFEKLVKFNPKTLVGDGPYKLASITTQEAKLLKWNGFYDAKHITVNEILEPGYQQPTVNETLLSGQSDYSSGWLYMPQAIVQKWTTTQNAHLRAVPGTFEGQIIFNDSKFPYNKLAVRQALAYALNFKAADQAAWGIVSPHAQAPTIPDGLVPPVAEQYLTKAQLKKLNPYHHNAKKATSLLKSVGFKKIGGKWMLPNGKPWKINLSINTTWTDQILAFKVFVEQLDAFGIKATLDTVGSDAYVADFPTGNFQFAAYCCEGGSPPDPLEDLSGGPIGPGENYIASGTNKGDRGIAFGPTATVPGLGKVNVPQTLGFQASTVSPGSKMRQLTWDWARFVDEQLPFIEYAVFNNQIAYNTTNFKWPSTKNPLWESLGGGHYDIVVLQEKGLLKPK